MPLKLERALKREVDIRGAAYTVTLSALGVRLVRKGFRKGHAVSWRRLLELAAGTEARTEAGAGARAGADTSSGGPASDPAPPAATRPEPVRR